LNYLNIYYAQEALDKDLFSYDGEKLVLGKSALRIAHHIKKDRVETFLMIGENLLKP
jgi:hypothetical protein